MIHTRSAIAALALMGCVGTFDIAGGPQHVRIQARGDAIIAQLRPLVSDDARATAQLEHVAARERRGKVLIYTGLGLTTLCLLASISSNSSSGGSSNLGLVVGLCGAAIGASIAGLVVTPKPGTYGEPLRTFNDSHRDTPFVAPKLKVP